MASPHTPEHAHGHAAGGHAHGVGHVVSPKILIANALALLVLTVVTVAAANVSFEALEMPELHIIVALGIAVLKATLVCMFFMHLRWDRPFNAFVIVGSVGFVLLFITFAMTDSNQYQKDLIKDESTVIQGELAKLPPPLTHEQLADHEAPAH